MLTSSYKKVLTVIVEYINTLYELPNSDPSALDTLKETLFISGTPVLTLDTFLLSEIFFSITNTTLGFFSEAVNLPQRPFIYLPPTRFISNCQNLITRFITTDLVDLSGQIQTFLPKKRKSEVVHLSRLDVASRGLIESIRNAKRLLQKSSAK